MESKGIDSRRHWNGRGGMLSAFSPLRAMAMRKGQKAVVVTFGGGTRDEETFMPDGQENIPHLLKEFIPQGTFFTQVVNRGHPRPLCRDRKPGHGSLRDL